MKPASVTVQKLARIQEEPKGGAEGWDAMPNAHGLKACPQRRLGNLKNGAKDITGHAWFRGLSWEALLNKTVKPPVRGGRSNTACGHSNTSRLPRAVLALMPVASCAKARSEANNL